MGTIGSIIVSSWKWNSFLLESAGCEMRIDLAHKCKFSAFGDLSVVFAHTGALDS